MYLCDMIVALRHIVLLFTTLLVVFSEGRAVGIERVAKKNGVFEAADNATRLRYSKAWNHLDLAESGSKVDPAVITKLADDILDNPALETFLEGGVGRVKPWEALDVIGVDQAIRTNITHLENIGGYFTKFPNRTSSDLVTTVNQFNNVDDYINILPDIVNNSSVRGTRFDDFVSVSGFGNNFHHAEYSYHLWKSENWSALENFFNSNNINNWNGTIWPPNFGFKNISHSESGITLKNKVFDRFQGNSELDGSFASPVLIGEGIDDLVFTYDSRALGSAPQTGMFYIKFKLIDSPSNMNFDYGDAIPWFGTNGGGTQIKSSLNFGNLEKGVHYEILEKMYYNGTNWISQ